jgi:hypothetical protein
MLSAVSFKLPTTSTTVLQTVEWEDMAITSYVEEQSWHLSDRTDDKL